MNGNASITLLAPAKLNLALDVLNKRADGYHELDMLMVSVSLYDTLSMQPSSTSHVSYTGMAAPQNDTVTRALAAYRMRTRRHCGARVQVQKRIPTEAGLGGGSADAAAALRGMQRFYGALSSEALLDAALEVGTDVPYCLHNDACRAGGVGEKLIYLRTPRLPLWFLILKPQSGISTSRLFSTLRLPVAHPRVDLAQQALVTANSALLGSLLQNALQPAACAILPEIDALCNALLQRGALGAAMTGSGSALFGLFASEQTARRAQTHFSDCAFHFVCKSIRPFEIDTL
ncbi:MAG: 4-(cytidine 5'-diphospho)-2-C-methyl-D-erythritol kinase [Clostridiales bacterium]|jgi:4-diphosphocytidyl-2-C-methyl-D-erythritol kinase|nr:4-(cytidine 5'-diphospho)-2-C-methyl-D-erythritol kinase [Clostridiales bacterium]